MKKVLGSLLVISALGALSNPAYAAECVLPEGKKAADLSIEDLNTHYQCARDELVKSYQQGGQDLALKYTEWKAGATGPAKPGGGIHSNQVLMTYVNPIGYDLYVQYKIDPNLEFPIGTVIAKESYKIKNSGKIKKGLLLAMTKVGNDKAPKTDGWVYSGVKANGKKFKAPQKFCHNCHQAWTPIQDSLGYPVEAVRIKN